MCVRDLLPVLSGDFPSRPFRIPSPVSYTLPPSKQMHRLLHSSQPLIVLTQYQPGSEDRHQLWYPVLPQLLAMAPYWIYFSFSH